MIRPLAIVLAAILATVSFGVTAEQSKSFGDYTVHYSAFTTDILTPAVAKSYRIPRSKYRALHVYDMWDKTLHKLTKEQYKQVLAALALFEEWSKREQEACIYGRST